MDKKDRNKLIDELKQEHLIILDWLDELNVKTKNNHKDLYGFINNFKQYIVEHLDKEDTILYTDFYLTSKNNEQFKHLEDSTKHFEMLKETLGKAIQTLDKDTISKFIQMVRFRIHFEENNLYEIFTKK